MTARARMLTPVGPAAIAVIEVEGEGAERALGRAFRGRKGLPEAGRAARGEIVDAGGEVADEVVLVATGERWEICGHGGRGAVERVMEALRAAGVEEGEAPALPPSARARTWLAFKVAREVEEGRRPADDPAAAALMEPRKVMLAGAPNAGKSSLFNALLERERSIVSEEAGTTRDVIEEETALEGVPVVLCDCAGLSDQHSPGNAEHAENAEDAEFSRSACSACSAYSASPGALLAGRAADGARRAVATADLVIRCVDGSQALENENENELLVITKADLPAAFDSPPGALRVSAKTGTGIERLALAIATRALGADPRTLEASPEARDPKPEARPP